MNIQARSEWLQKIYNLYDSYCAGFDLKCRKGCAMCCTANVTMTSLEAALILSHWRAEGQTPPMPELLVTAAQPRFQPTLTFNQLAALCVQGLEVPEEAADPDVGPCPLLANDQCAIYSARPFGCRAMVSRTDCVQSSAADMPDEVLAANSLFLQYIEAIDAQGISGNLTDMLICLARPDHRAAYEGGRIIELSKGFATNRCLPVLMIPPEHRQRLQPLIGMIQKTLRTVTDGRPSVTSTTG